MRTLQITHEEIELIKKALQYVYDNNLEIIKNNKKILGEATCAKIIETANMYWDVQNIFDGERDV